MDRKVADCYLPKTISVFVAGGERMECVWLGVCECVWGRSSREAGLGRAVKNGD